ncbi:hypothetical protein, partial [Thiohalocapsa sp.]|uniref:hypothetical protein n=1 Tax=Thiohalocapsa sp. TaxID=2497641 RepID=UPI0025D4E804
VSFVVLTTLAADGLDIAVTRTTAPASPCTRAPPGLTDGALDFALRDVEPRAEPLALAGRVAADGLSLRLQRFGGRGGLWRCERCPGARPGRLCAQAAGVVCARLRGMTPGRGTAIRPPREHLAHSGRLAAVCLEDDGGYVRKLCL